MNNKTTNVRYLAQLALLAAIEVVMKLMGLGSVPVGPLYMSFLTVPIDRLLQACIGRPYHGCNPVFRLRSSGPQEQGA